MSKITIKQVQDLHKKLKEQYPNWASLVSEGISKEKDWKRYKESPLSPEGVSHIVKDNTKGQLHRRLFMLVGARLLLSATQKKEETNEILEEIANANN